MASATPETPTNDFQIQATTALERCRGLKIESDDDYETTGQFGKMLKELKGQIEAHFNPHVKRAYDAWNGLTTEKAKCLKPVDEAIKLCAGAMGRYKQECDRRAAEAKRIEEEQAKAAAAAESEAAEKFFREQGDVAAAEAVKEVAPQMIAQAAQEVRSAPAPQLAPKVEGEKKRTSWSYRVVDESLVPDNFWCIDHVALKAHVQAKKGDCVGKIPGVEVFSDVKVHI